jgi:hypothetical protein
MHPAISAGLPLASSPTLLPHGMRRALRRRPLPVLAILLSKNLSRATRVAFRCSASGCLIIDHNRVSIVHARIYPSYAPSALSSASPILILFH